MKKYITLAIMAISTVSMLAISQSAKATSFHSPEDNKPAGLRIGDVAPELKAKWVKGKQIKSFEKGMVYVLEFWATWCGPCIKAMPHVSALAKKHSGKAEFIGVSVWERGRPGQRIDALVENFVKSKADTMSYGVCMDTSDGFMVKNWVEAAGQSTIPATIIVDKNGKIAWIGQPMEMDVPLSQIIAGNFDSQTYASKINAQQERAFQQQQQREAQQKAIQPIETAMRAKDYSLAISEYQKLTSQQPTLKPLLATYYYTALLHTKPEQAYKDAVAAIDTVSRASVYARTFAMEPGLDKRFYQYAIDHFEAQPDANVGKLQPLAEAYSNLGDMKKAAEKQQIFVDWLNNAKSPAPAEFVEKQMLKLKQYKEAIR